MGVDVPRSLGVPERDYRAVWYPNLFVANVIPRIEDRILAEIFVDVILFYKVICPTKNCAPRARFHNPALKHETASAPALCTSATSAESKPRCWRILAQIAQF